jgi:hypothetical protein
MPNNFSFTRLWSFVLWHYTWFDICKIWNCQVLHYDIKSNLKKTWSFQQGNGLICLWIMWRTWGKKWDTLSQEWYNWPMILWKSWEEELDRCGLTNENIIKINGKALRQNCGYESIFPCNFPHTLNSHFCHIAISQRSQDWPHICDV